MTRTAADKARRKTVQEFKAEPPRPNCPTPAKRAYESEAAIHKALRSSLFLGQPIRIYHCECGSMHLTRRVLPIKETA